MNLSADSVRFLIAFFLVVTSVATMAVPEDEVESVADSRSLEWFVKLPGELERELEADEEGGVRATIALPAGGLVYATRQRETLRPNRSDFEANRLAMDVKMVSGSDEPVRCNLFVKDKDGYWFQSREDFAVEPNQWRCLSVPLPADANGLRPVGHRAAWDGQFVVAIHTIGVSLYDGESRDVRVFCRPPRFEGARNERGKPLRVVDWRMPSMTGLHEMIKATFKLSREYFNPFDPEEIRVDAEVMDPNGDIHRWPAFHTRDWERRIRHNMESLSPVGVAHWEWRYTPTLTGEHKIRLIVEEDAVGEDDQDASDSQEESEPETAAENRVVESDVDVDGTTDESGVSEGATANSATEPKGDRLVTPWRTLRVEPSEEHGFVRVCAADPQYLELTTGEFFYPIGFNLHTIRDERSEERLKTGYVPDRGTFAYDDYFAAMGRQGVNATEIWMAAWSTALEWTSAQREYRGLGWYNMANAWKLDHILDSAGKHGVTVQLVLDNHGKLSDGIDPEWENSPFNRDNPFAVADGGFLKNTREFFTSDEARRFYRRRNRYIAARWGAFTNVFGVELWSEVDLVSGHKAAYKSGESVDWHRAEATYFKKLDQGGHVVTTHTCADYQNTLGHRKLFDLPEIDYVVGDGYRNPKISIVEHMRRHQRALRDFKKPIIITEYGGTHQASAVEILLADLHGGLWSAFFKGEGGGPFLWWHDFVHANDYYPHYQGFAAFLSDVDPRGKDFVFSEAPVFGEPFHGDGRERLRPCGMVAGEPLHPFAPTWRIMALAKQPPLAFSQESLRFELDAFASNVNTTLGCLTLGDADERYGWVFVKDAMRRYPVDCPMKIPPPRSTQSVALRDLRPDADYMVRFQNTMTGETLEERGVHTDHSGLIRFALPPFINDVAFKVRRRVVVNQSDETKTANAK